MWDFKNDRYIKALGRLVVFIIVALSSLWTLVVTSILTIFVACKSPISGIV